MSVFGDNIKLLRESRGITQQQLAEIVGAKSYTTITKWEKGENFPRGKDIILMCNYFNVSSDDLLGIGNGNSLVAESFYPYVTAPISAGLPELVDSVCELDNISVPDSIMGKYAGHEDIQMMRVNGESMNRVIPDKSLIAVKRTALENIKDGDIVVYNDNYEYAVKRMYRAGNKVIFRPDSHNPEYTDYVTEADENLQIIGKVVIYIVELD